MKTASNKHRVPKKIWSKWSFEAQRLFNEMYQISAKQWAFTHPKAQKILPKHWDTTRWNTAWVAAEMLSSGVSARNYRIV